MVVVVVLVDGVEGEVEVFVLELVEGLLLLELLI